MTTHCSYRGCEKQSDDPVESEWHLAKLGRRGEKQHTCWLCPDCAVEFEQFLANLRIEYSRTMIAVPIETGRA